MNTTRRMILAVILPLVFFSLFVLSLPLSSESPAEAAALSQTLPPTPVPILADELETLTKVYTHSTNLIFDGEFPARFDGDNSRVIPSTPTAEWLIWYITSDGVKEFQAATYHLVDRPITNFKFYGSSSGAAGSFSEITPTMRLITPTLTAPGTTDWRRVRYEFVPPVGMDFIKVEFPGGIPIDRNPRQLGAVSYGDPIPIINRVTPSIGPDNVPVTIDIYGDNFTSGSIGYLVPVTDTANFVPLLQLRYVDRHRLRATLPVTMTLGSYHLKVANPAGSRTYHVAAYKVMDGDLFNDLYANEFDLVIDPRILRQGETTMPKLALGVRRWGGRNALNEVKVDFYDGDPSAGGIYLGTGTASSVAPYSRTLTSEVTWNLFGGGSYTIYAKIDPQNLVVEANEDNNVISRTVTIHYLPPQTDDLPPQVDSFLINEGSPVTGERAVTLKTVASDMPAGSAVASVFYLEYEFVQGTGTWNPVAFSDSDNDGTPDWLPYDSALALEGYPWTLTPTPGMHYLQAWVADAYGNISPVPGTALINLLPLAGSSMAPAPILQDEIHLYRLTLQAGQRVMVNLTSVQGDADLYVWKPDGSAQGIQETTNPVETVSFTVAVSGTYQIEVAGFTNATYTLEIVDNPAKASVGNTLSAAKGRPRFGPFTDPGSEPSEDVGLPEAPMTITQLFVPFAAE